MVSVALSMIHTYILFLRIEWAPCIAKWCIVFLVLHFQRTNILQLVIGKRIGRASESRRLIESQLSLHLSGSQVNAIKGFLKQIICQSNVQMRFIHYCGIVPCVTSYCNGRHCTCTSDRGLSVLVPFDIKYLSIISYHIITLFCFYINLHVVISMQFFEFFIGKIIASVNGLGSIFKVCFVDHFETQIVWLDIFGAVLAIEWLWVH